MNAKPSVGTALAAKIPRVIASLSLPATTRPPMLAPGRTTFQLDRARPGCGSLGDVGGPPTGVTRTSVTIAAPIASRKASPEFSSTPLARANRLRANCLGFATLACLLPLPVDLRGLPRQIHLIQCLHDMHEVLVGYLVVCEALLPRKLVESKPRDRAYTALADLSACGEELERMEHSELIGIGGNGCVRDTLGNGSASFLGGVYDFLGARPVFDSPEEELPESFASISRVSWMKFATICDCC